MTSTPYHTGLFDEKPSSKVLRPPGGGTSDIFGNSDNQAQTPRAVRNHMASNIFGSDQQNSVKNNGDSVRRSQKNIDSYSRLFGEPDRPMTPAKNHMRSNIPIGPNANATVVDGKNNGSTNGSSSSITNSSSGTITNGHHNHAARNGNKMENGGDHHNGVTKTEDDEPKFDELPNSNQLPIPSNSHSISESDYPLQSSSKLNSNNDNNNFTEDGINNDNASSELQKIHNNNNNNNNANNSFENKSTTIKSPKFRMNNGNNTKILNGSNDGSSSNLTSSSLVSPSSTITTGTGSSASGSGSGSGSSNSKYSTRNPVTGYGIDEPIQKTRRALRKDGNPVTGEGYKPAGAEINTSVPALNGANQVIIKNRIPPGGYSSGLW